MLLFIVLVAIPVPEPLTPNFCTGHLAIHSVIFGGILYTRADLDQASNQVESNASSLGLAAKVIWADRGPWTYGDARALCLINQSVPDLDCAGGPLRNRRVVGDDQHGGSLLPEFLKQAQDIGT